MDIRQCMRCSKLFQYRGSPNCPDCVRALDDTFLEVRHYLEDHPHATIDDVCEACQADENDVLRWLREGRLILSHDSSPLLACQSCRKPIQSGRYCETCAVNVIGQLEATARHLGGERPNRDRSNDHTRSHVRINGG